MKFFNMIKRVFRRLWFGKKHKRPTGTLTEEVKTFYDVELLRNARVVTEFFGDSHLNRPHGGVEVKFIRHTDLAVEPTSGTAGATLDAENVIHGEWRCVSLDPQDPYFVCTNCKIGYSTIYHECEEMNYCPNCGAKMDGGNDDGNQTDSI